MKENGDKEGETEERRRRGEEGKGGKWSFPFLSWHTALRSLRPAAKTGVDISCVCSL